MSTNNLREAAQQALEALGSSLYPQRRQVAAIAALKAALAEPVPIIESEITADKKEPMADLSWDATTLAWENSVVYWYVGTDGKYYSSNEVKLFMDVNTKALHLDPPQWRKDKGDLIPLYTAPPRTHGIGDE